MTTSSKNRSLLLLFLAITAAACGQGNDTEVHLESPDPSNVGSILAPAPSLDELANATFVGIQDEPVELADGRWEGPPFVEGGASAPAVGLIRDFQLTGDIVGDSAEETAILLWTSSGGSGTFDYLAVTGRIDDAVKNLGTAELGDRVQVRQGRIANGTIELDVVQAGPEDAACCPTEMARRTFELSTDGLLETSSEVTGTLSIAELQGHQWTLTDLAWDEPAPAQPEVTLVFEEDRIAGSAGCNGYFASLEDGGETPTSVTLGPLGGTRKMCPEEIMAVEDRFLRQLGSVSSYSFLAGKLALSWQADNDGGVMLFSAP